MCTVSMIGDHYGDKWNPLNPGIQGTQPYPQPKTVEDWSQILNPPVRKSDFDALKKDVEEMKALLKRAIKYDEMNNEPHCEMEEKVALLKAVAKMVGVDLSEIFGNEKSS
jgi:hypothetical protein